MLRKRNLLVLTGVSLLALAVLSFTKLGRYLYRWMWLDQVEIGLVYSQDPLLDQELTQAIEDFRLDHPEVRFHVRTMHPNLYQDGQLAPVASALDNTAMIVGSSGQGRVLCEHGLILCQWPTGLPEGLSPKLLEKVTESGKVMGVPLYFSSFQVLYVNTNVLRTIPATQTELVAFLREHNNPLDYRFGFGLGDDALSFSGLMGGAGYFEAQTDKTLALEQAFTLLDKLKFYEELSPRRCSGQCMEELFLKGKIPLLVADESRHTELRKVLGDKLLRLPVQSLSDRGIPMKTTYDGRFIFQRKNLTPDQAEAVQNFTQALAGGEFQQRVAERGMRLAALRSASVSSQDAWEPGFITLSEADHRSLLTHIKPRLDAFYAGKILPHDAAAL